MHTLNWIVNNVWKKFHNVTVLGYKQGFFQFGGTRAGLRNLFKDDMDSIHFNLSDVYSVHFSNHVSAEYQKLFRNKSWLFESSSAGATAIRMVLPADFNGIDLDEKFCTSTSV